MAKEANRPGEPCEALVLRSPARGLWSSIPVPEQPGLPHRRDAPLSPQELFDF